jgi:hypothetical protein
MVWAGGESKKRGVLQLAAAVFDTLRQLKTGGFRVSLRQAKIFRQELVQDGGREPPPAVSGSTTFHPPTNFQRKRGVEL